MTSWRIVPFPTPEGPDKMKSNPFFIRVVLIIGSFYLGGNGKNKKVGTHLSCPNFFTPVSPLFLWRDGVGPIIEKMDANHIGAGMIGISRAGLISLDFLKAKGDTFISALFDQSGVHGRIIEEAKLFVDVGIGCEHVIDVLKGAFDVVATMFSSDVEMAIGIADDLRFQMEQIGADHREFGATAALIEIIEAIELKGALKGFPSS